MGWRGGLVEQWKGPIVTEPMQVLGAFLQRQAGIVCDVRHLEFAQHRLAPVARAAGLDGLPALASRVEAGDRAIRRSVIEAMATHETSFFRDRATFAFIEGTVLPALRAARAQGRRLRIWSAACSTGQEPYAIAMLLDEALRDFTGWSIDLQASDLSARAVEAARLGRYNQFEVQRGLSTARLLRYFARDGDGWRIGEHLRERISFSVFNLMDDMAGFGPCALVLCRNVFIYFDAATTRAVLSRLASAVVPGGFLIVGASETLLGMTGAFKPHPAQAGALVRC